MKLLRFRTLSGFVVLLLVALLLASFGLGTMGGEREQVCYIDLTTGRNECQGPAEIVDLGKGQALIALHECGCYEIVLKTSDVRGHWLNLGNSPTNNFYGGDAGTFSYDSELCIIDHMLTIWGNGIGSAGCPQFSYPYVRIKDFVEDYGAIKRMFPPRKVRKSFPDGVFTCFPVYCSH